MPGISTSNSIKHVAEIETDSQTVDPRCDPNKAKAISVGGVPVDLYSSSDYAELVASAIKNCEKKVFFYTNAHQVVLANTTSPDLKIAYHKHADYVLCDGAGIQLGARMKAKPVPMKTAYNVWFWDFAEFCGREGYKIFLLGADHETVSTAAANLEAHSPGLTVRAHHGYFTKKSGHPENSAVVNKINSFQPDILLVGFGSPAQERWILENKMLLRPHVFLACGGAFEYFSGNRRVAPKWMRKLKLEWFYLMLKEPARLGKRYLRENPLFFYLVLKAE